MSWEDILKAPPIPNPKPSTSTANDSMSMKELEGLFEKVADPIIEQAAKDDIRYARVYLKDLKLSEEVAIKTAKKLYENMGYRSIFFNKDRVVFEL